MTRSVATHAPKLQAPKLDDPELIKLGAAHFLTGCAPCHASPDFRASPIEIGATPPPPLLYSAAADFSPSQLHWIVKHGVKMTAMPPWPVQNRDDEVWALVAFLEALPHIRPGEYAPMAGVADESKQSVTNASLEDLADGALSKPCSACHGDNGVGQRTKAPKLAGLNSGYIRAQLESFRDGSRPSGIMQPIAVGLSDAKMAKLADYFSHQNAAGPSVGGSKGSGRGAQIAERGLGASVTACSTCHNERQAEMIPPLSGQSAEYLENQLALFRQDIRKGPNSSAMRTIAKGLSPEDAHAVAEYLSNEKADARNALDLRDKRSSSPEELALHSSIGRTQR